MDIKTVLVGNIYRVLPVQEVQKPQGSGVNEQNFTGHQKSGGDSFLKIFLTAAEAAGHPELQKRKEQQGTVWK